MTGSDCIPLTLPASGEELLVPVRRSERASRISVRVTSAGPELILPRWVSIADGVRFLNSASDWIDKTLRKQKKRLPAAVQTIREYPEKLVLASEGRTLKVLYRFEDVSWCGGRIDADTLHVSGNVLESKAVSAVLERVMKREAERFLLPLLSRYSEETGIAYCDSSVRVQKSRWGSCSARRNISLNAMLLFVPPECVRYVMIHELCHIRHMDHSPEFWTEVAKFVPDWKYLRNLLKRTPIPFFGKE